jgi:hypothetical protein
MARIARVVVPGLPYHLTQRGNRREPVFFGAEDYQFYRRLIATAERRAGAETASTMTIARTSASGEMVLAEKPSANITANVPTRATGTAMIGINVARRLPRKTKRRW